MRVILQKHVPNLGAVGDVVRVKDGYGRNYLVPRGLAVIADDRNVGRLEHQKRQAAAKQSKLLEEARQHAAKIGENAITFRRQSGDEGKIFGSVTARDIVEALAEAGFELDRHSVTLPEPIKNLGVFTVTAKLAPEVEAEVKVYVIAE